MDHYRLTPGDAVVQKTPFGFDVSVWEFVWPLIAGARLVMAAPGLHRDPEGLGRLIRAEGVTTIHFVPSMLAAFAAAGEVARCAGLRRILCSGEALPADLQRAVLGATGAELSNLYGPTEAAIDVTHWTCRDAADADGVPIGRPIANTAIRVLDADLHPVAAGGAGELCIAGVNLARGYRGRPGLTAERFVPDPEGPPGTRLYRTGDLARWRADGALAYLGRRDQQIKLRGMRIEPGEIEAGLRGEPGVAEAAVVLRGEALVAYVVASVMASGDATPTEADLRAGLGRRLPAHLVPARIVRLAALPLTPSGKLDRNALPDPDPLGGARPGPPPRPPAERLVAAVWTDVLGIPNITADADFFDLGGHSIAAMKAKALLSRDHGIDVPMRSFFDHSRLDAFAAHLPAGTGAGPETMQRQLGDMDRWLTEIEG